VCPLVAVAVAVVLELVATPLNRAMSIQELAEVVAKGLQTHGEVELMLSMDPEAVAKAGEPKALEALMQVRAVERMLQEILALTQQMKLAAAAVADIAKVEDVRVMADPELS
jgi:hypothetical protein